MAMLNSLQMNDPLSVKIHCHDCFLNLQHCNRKQKGYVQPYLSCLLMVYQVEVGSHNLIFGGKEQQLRSSV